MTTRLTMLCHAATAASRQARFPADEPLDPEGAAEAARVAAAPPWAATVARAGRRVAGPALRTRQTAAAFGTDFADESALRDCDYGTWTGLSLTEVGTRDPEGAAAWISDPCAAPHGGERLDHLLTRVARWMGEEAARGGRVLAVTHAPVLRAAIIGALAAGPDSFWRIDVPPLASLEFTHDGRRWALLALRPPPRRESPTSTDAARDFSQPPD